MRPSVVIALIFYAFAWVLLFEEIIFGRPLLSEAEALVVVVAGSLVFIWFLLDSRERKIETSLGLKIVVLLIPLAGIPYYKVRYSGWASAVRFVGLFVIVTMIAPTGIAIALGYGVEL